MYISWRQITTDVVAGKSHLINMFANFFVILVSDHPFELYQGLGTSCDVATGYLRDDVIKGRSWICPAEYSHVRRRWCSDNR